MWPNLQFPADLVIFTREILNGKLPFLCKMWCLHWKIRIFQWMKTDYYGEWRICEFFVSVSKFPFLALKMRNLSDMNDHYNLKDVCLLYEIVENRFEYNSASALSGCIKRNIPKVILVLPANAETAQVFEKTLTRGFPVGQSSQASQHC